nr:HTH domain-containing protein [Criibacterium bergeronii]
MIEKSSYTSEYLTKKIGVTKRTIVRDFNSLQEKNNITN